MSIIFFFLAIVLAALNWLAVWKQWKRVEYITKPGTMVSLFFWLLLWAGVKGPLILFAAGVVFSLVGDVLLMLPREQFLGGLVAFLTAHLCYIAGFNITQSPTKTIGLVFTLAIAVVAGLIYRRLAQGLTVKNMTKLRLPVLIYTIVISVMVLSALLTLVRSDWTAATAVLVSLGAVSFFFSDALLAWNRFIAPALKGHLTVMITYHLGQILIALGVAVQFMK